MSTPLSATALSWAANGTPVLDRVALEVEPGAVCGILGPNGSGKTTLLRLLAQVLSPHAGSVSIGGDDAARLGRRERSRRLAVLVQDQPAELELTTMDLVLIGRSPHKRRLEPDTPEDLRIARAALAGVGAGALEGRRIETLSGGERQRVQIARVLAQSTPLLLLDEPTSQLDLRHQHQLFALLRASDATVIASLHDPQLAASYCDRLVVLDRGRVAAAGPPADVLTADLLREVWGVEADVRLDETGRLQLRIDGPAP